MVHPGICMAWSLCRSHSGATVRSINFHRRQGVITLHLTCRRTPPKEKAKNNTTVAHCLISALEAHFSFFPWIHGCDKRLVSVFFFGTGSGSLCYLWTLEPACFHTKSCLGRSILGGRCAVLLSAASDASLCPVRFRDRRRRRPLS